MISTSKTEYYFRRQAPQSVFADLVIHHFHVVDLVIRDLRFTKSVARHPHIVELFRRDLRILHLLYTLQIVDLVVGRSFKVRPAASH